MQLEHAKTYGIQSAMPQNGDFAVDMLFSRNLNLDNEALKAWTPSLCLHGRDNDKASHKHKVGDLVLACPHFSQT
jgi:hypothetical protein